MTGSIQKIAATFTLAAGLCFGAGAISQCESGKTHNGIACGAAAVLSIASGVVGLKTRPS